MEPVPHIHDSSMTPPPIPTRVATRRGNGFRHPEPEVMGSCHGTHDLIDASREPIAAAPGGPRPAPAGARRAPRGRAGGVGGRGFAGAPHRRSVRLRRPSDKRSTPPKGGGHLLAPEAPLRERN